MLTAVRGAVALSEGAPAPRPQFEESLGWFVLQDEAHRLNRLDGHGARVLASLRRDPLAASRAEAATLAWLLARDAAPPGGPVVSAEVLLQASRDFCDRQRLADRATVEAWLAARVWRRSTWTACCWPMPGRDNSGRSAGCATTRP